MKEQTLTNEMTNEQDILDLCYKVKLPLDEIEYLGDVFELDLAYKDDLELLKEALELNKLTFKEH